MSQDKNETVEQRIARWWTLLNCHEWPADLEKWPREEPSEDCQRGAFLLVDALLHEFVSGEVREEAWENHQRLICANSVRVAGGGGEEPR